jgi:hypothetical protein
VSYTLETRVERLERQQPSNPYEHLSDAELEARLAAINERLSEIYGFDSRAMDRDERRMLDQAEEQGEEALKTVVDQLRRKYGPLLPRAGS